MHDLGAVDQEAWHDLAGLARRVAELAAATGAELLVTHPYEGGHPDHDATAFVAAAAAALLARGAAPGDDGPVVVECTSYHADADAPDHLVSGVFRPVAGAGAEHAVALDDAARARKAAMYACHASQQRVLAHLPPTPVERFRVAPAYDFTRPPPSGPVWYERLGWSVRADDVARAAAAAWATLGTGPTAPAPLGG